MLKLYVWENVLTDYSSGIMFALAENSEEARKEIQKKCRLEHDFDVGDDLKIEPRLVEQPEGFLIFGGG